MPILPAPPIDIKKIIKEFEDKLNGSFSKERYGVGISNVNEDKLKWKYDDQFKFIIFCYKAANEEYALDIKKEIVKLGITSLPDDILIEKGYNEKSKYVFLRNLMVGESAQVEYEG